MRANIERHSAAKKARTLDHLIQRFESNKTVSDDTIELLRFLLKPKRDYIEHGRPLPLLIAKTVLRKRDGFRIIFRYLCCRRGRRPTN